MAIVVGANCLGAVCEIGSKSWQQNRRRPGGKRVLREDSTGQTREYFLYELETTIYPDRPTTIDGQDVRIIMNYPIEIGRSRGPFSMLERRFLSRLAPGR